MKNISTRHFFELMKFIIFPFVLFLSVQTCGQKESKNELIPGK